MVRDAPANPPLATWCLGALSPGSLPRCCCRFQLPRRTPLLVSASKRERGVLGTVALPAPPAAASTQPLY